MLVVIVPFNAELSSRLVARSNQPILKLQVPDKLLLTKMPHGQKLMEWFRLYLLTLTITLAILSLGTLLCATWFSRPFFNILRSALILGALGLVTVGFASILPLSEYRYMRSINPAIVREGAKRASRERGPNRLGVVLGILGLTLLVIYLFIFQ